LLPNPAGCSLLTNTNTHHQFAQFRFSLLSLAALEACLVLELGDKGIYGQVGLAGCCSGRRLLQGWLAGCCCRLPGAGRL
jgi:hypothetical protein